jgi:thymidylate kinase
MIGLIIEGITGSGKTRLLGHVQRVLATRAPSNTKLFIGEHYTERALEHLQEAGTLVPLTVIEHLHQLFAVLDPLSAAKQRSKFRDRAGNATVLVLMERFLLGRIAIMRMHDHDAWKLTPELVASITELYRRADDCGLRRVILRITPEAIRDRVLSTRHHRNAAWSEFLAAQGDDHAIVHRYVREQNLLLEASEALSSIVQPVYVDVDAVWEDSEFEAVADDLVRRFFGR